MPLKSGRRRKPILWIVDPWPTLDHADDTSLRIAQEIEILGRKCMVAERTSISLDFGGTRLTDSRALRSVPSLAQVTVQAAPFRDAYYQPHAEPLKNTQTYPLDAFSQIHYRPDPPITSAYTKPLQLLVFGCERLGRHAPRLINPAERLLGANEKLECFVIPELSLESCVSSDERQLSVFLNTHHAVVVKPLDGAQSKGVFKLSASDEPELLHRKWAEATDRFTVPVLAQKFLPQIESGEIRLWFAGFKLIGCARKRPLQGDFRVNIDGGSAVEKHTLSRPEKIAAKRIAAYLKKTGIELAAVDLIGGKITDFNFTSPGLIPRMEKALGKNLARPIAKRLVSLR